MDCNCWSAKVKVRHVKVQVASKLTNFIIVVLAEAMYPK